MDFQEVIKQQQPKKLLLLYHWDTDGLACAALFMKHVETVSPATEIVLMHPTINNYFLLEHEYAFIRDAAPDVLLTTDINFPVDVIEKLESIVSRVFVFDHHSQTVGIQRPGVQDPSYPGCSMLVNDYLMQPLSLVSVLGMVGDQEERIQEDARFYPQVEEMMKQHQLTFEQVLRLTKLIDTAYIVGDTTGLEYGIQLLTSHPIAALTDARLLKNETAIRKELDRECAIPPQEVAPHVLFTPISSRMNLISEVTRTLSRAHPDALIVTMQKRTHDASVYVRRRNLSLDLGVIVDFARSRGYNAGGKPEVVGIVLPLEHADTFTKDLFELLASRTI